MNFLQLTTNKNIRLKQIFQGYFRGHKEINMYKKIVFVIGVLAVSVSSFVLAEDAELKLNTNNGTSKFVVQDSDASEVAGVDSDGNMVVKGTMTIEGASFSVAGSTLVVNGGKVAIGNLQLVGTGASLPTPGPEYRGSIFMLQGTPDKLYICMQKGTGGQYKWALMNKGE